jgi:hypothetical protein
MDIIRLIIGQLNSEEGESVPKRKALVNRAFLIFLSGSLPSAFATPLPAGTRIVPQCFYPGKPLDTANGLFFCFPFRITWLFIKGSVSDLPEDTCTLPHLLKPTQGTFE